MEPFNYTKGSLIVQKKVLRINQIFFTEREKMVQELFTERF